MRTVRIGQVVPSSNTTMETEVPEILRAVAASSGAFRPTFHSARMRMKHVSREELAAMNAGAVQAIQHLADAPLDVAGFACLVAIMAMGKGYHRAFAEEMTKIAEQEGATFPIVTSAGALVDEVKSFGAQRIAMLMPYSDQLSRLVADYIEAEGIVVQDYRNFSVTNNAEVGKIATDTLLRAMDDLQWRNVDLVVASACVQMPSLNAIEAIEKITGLPTTSAAICTSRAILRAVGINHDTRGFGSLLDPTALHGGSNLQVVC